VIFLRHGGKPKGEEDYEDMTKGELAAVTSFESFIEKLRFK
jgi:hypothetical protein